MKKLYLKVKKPSLILVMSLILIVSISVIVLVSPSPPLSYRFEGVETQLTTDISDQFDPSISGDIIVYTDRRSGDANIYMYNISSNVEKKISVNGGDQFFNDNSDNVVVYTEYESGNAEIVMYDIESGDTTPLNDHPANQLRPAISGNLVVFEDDRNGDYDIYMVDINTLTETRITDDPSHQGNPDIKGSVIVWEDYRNGNPDIYMLNLDTNTITQVTDDPARDIEPSIDGDIISFGSNRVDVGDIYYFEISTERMHPIPSSGYQRNPAVSGDYIAYENYAGGDADIWIYSISIGVSEKATDNPAEQNLHDLSGNRLVYTDSRNDNLDIYLFEFIFEEEGEPDIEVSPLKYNFGELKVGSSISTIVTISNVGDLDLTVSDIAFQVGSSNDFSITQLELLDQVNDFTTGISYGCGGAGHLYQSFIPSNSYLSAIDLLFRAGGEFPADGYHTTIKILYDNPNGELLGETTVFVPGPISGGTELMVHFAFSEPILLIPGETYIIEWITPPEGGIVLTWMGADTNPYPNGNAFGCTGLPILDQDNTFITYTPPPSLPIKVSPNGILYVEITFSPSFMGLCSGVLEIISNDPDESIVEVQFTGVGDGVQDAVDEINEFIQDLPEDAFINNANERKSAFVEKLQEVIKLINAGNYVEAILKLKHDIRPKCDGSLGGNPYNDWITDPKAQQKLCEMIDALIAYLESLI